MNILLVEDEERAVTAFQAALEAADLTDYELTVAGDRDTALRCINEHFYDYVVCDVWIPADASSPRPEREHGIRVFEELQACSPGTPCVFLTGQPADDLETRRRLSRGGTEDIYGRREAMPLVELRTKSEIRSCAALLADAASQLEALRGVEVFVVGGEGLDAAEERVLQIATRRLGGTSVRVTRLGGLSGTGAFRAEIVGEGGRRIGQVFAKVGDFTRIRAEDASYGQYVPAQLPLGVFASRADAVRGGAGRVEGLFFTLADGFDESLFQCVAADCPRAVRVVGCLWKRLDAWDGAAESRRTTVGALRDVGLSSEVLDGLSDDLREAVPADVEAIELELPHWPQHGDLHAGNVLVRDEDPLLIDFADAGVRPGCYDAVVLELSLVFHPDSPFSATDWPTAEQAARWWDVDAFVVGCPAANVVRSCRRRALDTVGETGVAALGYAHAVRQLKYPDTRKDLAVAIAQSAAARLRRGAGAPDVT